MHGGIICPQNHGLQHGTRRRRGGREGVHVKIGNGGGYLTAILIRRFAHSLLGSSFNRRFHHRAPFGPGTVIKSNLVRSGDFCGEVNNGGGYTRSASGDDRAGQIYFIALKNGAKLVCRTQSAVLIYEICVIDIGACRDMAGPHSRSGFFFKPGKSRWAARIENCLRIGCKIVQHFAASAYKLRLWRSSEQSWRVSGEGGCCWPVFSAPFWQPAIKD